MSRIKRKRVSQLLYTGVAAAVLLQSGCLLVAAGAAAGGAAAGYAYYNGRLYRDYPAGMGDTLVAVRGALTDLQFPLVSEESGAEPFLVTRTTDGSKIRIYLDSVASRVPAEGTVTRVSVRVATFGDEAVSARILDQVARRLAAQGIAVVVPPGPAPIPGPPPPGAIQPTWAPGAPPETPAPPLAAPQPPAEPGKRQ
jgi:hypothetical protein